MPSRMRNGTLSRKLFFAATIGGRLTHVQLLANPSQVHRSMEPGRCPPNFDEPESEKGVAER